MKPLENEILKFIEPVYRFCLKRVSNRHDAEDLASEIILHVLDGAGKYEIQSFDAWVWRIAHNRYARYCEAKHVRAEFYSEDALFDLADDYDFVDRLTVTDEYETVFRYLHTLSSQYKNLLVDYYIGELPIRDLSKKYSLPETTIKWRLNISRRKKESSIIYYYHIFKYFCSNIYHNGGTRWLSANRIPQKSTNGIIPEGSLSEDDIVRLLQRNLIRKDTAGYQLNFACFTQDQFSEFSGLFRLEDKRIEKLLTNLISNIREHFQSFVPKRLERQINQWVSCFVHSITGYVTEELIARGILEKPDREKPLTNGVFYVEGPCINP